MNPFDFFDKIYCIHLPEHASRLENLSAELDKFNLGSKVTFVHAPKPHVNCTMPALKYPIGEFGAWLSHGKAIVHAIESGAENALFIEDDIFFLPWTERVLSASISELPQDWDIFFLSGNPMQPLEPASANLARITGKFHGAVAYSIPKRSLLKFYDMRLDMLEKRTPLADTATNQFAQMNNGYVTAPYVCLTQPGPSVIRKNQHRDYNTRIRQRWERFLPSTFANGQYT